MTMFGVRRTKTIESSALKLYLYHALMFENKPFGLSKRGVGNYTSFLLKKFTLKGVSTTIIELLQVYIIKKVV